MIDLDKCKVDEETAIKDSLLKGVAFDPDINKSERQT